MLSVEFLSESVTPVSLSCSLAPAEWNRMAKSEPEEMIEIEIDEREKQACLEEG